MNKCLHPTLVAAEHPYTRSSEPWQMDSYTAAGGCTSAGCSYDWKLFHYISGGGVGSFGRTVRQEVRSHRQTRFLVFAAILAVVWLCLLIF